MFHTIITIDIATIGAVDPMGPIQGLLNLLNEQIGYSNPAYALDIDEWKVEVHQEHNGVVSAVPGWRAPEGVSK